MNNFLAKAKQTVNNSTTNTTGGASNPFKGKGMPGMPPMPKGKKPPMPPSFKGKPILEKNPLTKPPFNNKNEVKEEPEKEEVKNKIETPLTKKNNQFINPQKKEEVKEPVKEIKKEEVPEEVAIPEEVVKEEKPKKKKTSKKKAEQAAVEEQEIVTMPSTEVSYEEALQSIRPKFQSKEWEELKKDITEKINAVEVTNTMKKPAISAALSDLCEVKTAIQYKFSEIEAMYENLSNKDNGIIETTKKFNSTGTNAEERKLNGLKAVCNFKNENNKVVNLLEVLYEVREQYTFLKKCMDLIQFKYNAINTISYSNK